MSEKTATLGFSSPVVAVDVKITKVKDFWFKVVDKLSAQGEVRGRLARFAVEFYEMVEKWYERVEEFDEVEARRLEDVAKLFFAVELNAEKLEKLVEVDEEFWSHFEELVRQVWEFGWEVENPVNEWETLSSYVPTNYWLPHPGIVLVQSWAFGHDLEELIRVYFAINSEFFEFKWENEFDGRLYFMLVDYSRKFKLAVGHCDKECYNVDWYYHAFEVSKRYDDIIDAVDSLKLRYYYREGDALEPEVC